MVWSVEELNALMFQTVTLIKFSEHQVTVINVQLVFFQELPMPTELFVSCHQLQPANALRSISMKEPHARPAPMEDSHTKMEIQTSIPLNQKPIRNLLSKRDQLAHLRLKDAQKAKSKATQKTVINAKRASQAMSQTLLEQDVSFQLLMTAIALRSIQWT
jgi:hypothetical protein